MNQGQQDRRAEYSIGIGIVLGMLSGAAIGEYLGGEIEAGLIIGGGIGLVLAAAYCGLAGSRVHGDDARDQADITD